MKFIRREHGCKKMSEKLRVRKGFTLLECFLLIVILGISIWAILSSAIGISNLGMFSREELKAYSVAVGLLDTLEAMPPASFDADFNGTVREAIIAMGGNGNHFRGYGLIVDDVASSDGVRLIQVTLSPPTGSKKAPLVIRKSLNRLSEKTVDDVVKS